MARKGGGQGWKEWGWVWESEGQRVNMDRSVRKEDTEAERQVSRGILGRRIQPPHPLRPLFEFSEWILVSYARKARASPTPRDSPHTLPYPPPHQEPFNKGVRNEV